MAKKLANNLVENEGAVKFNSLKDAGIIYTAFDESATFNKGDIIKFLKTENPEFYKIPIKNKNGEETDKYAVCTIVQVNGEEKRFYPTWLYKSCKNEDTGEITRPHGTVYSKLKKLGDLDKILTELFKVGGSIKLIDLAVVKNYKYSNNSQGTGVVRSFDFVE